MSDTITTVVIMMVFVAVFGGYVITSLLLLRFPKLLHKKKEIRFRATHISHRGGRFLPSRDLLKSEFRISFSALFQVSGFWNFLHSHLVSYYVLLVS